MSTRLPMVLDLSTVTCAAQGPVSLVLLVLLVVLLVLVRCGAPSQLFEWLLGLLLHRHARPEALELQDAYREARRRGRPYVQLPDGSLLLVEQSVCRRVCQENRLFADRGMPKNETINPLSAHLFSLEGERWRELRRAVSPVFTPRSLRDMLGLHAHTARDLRKELLHQLGARASVDLDLKDLMERYVTDDIGRTLFSVECGTLASPGSAFHRHCAASFNQSLWRRLRQWLLKKCPVLTVLLPYRSATATFFREVVEEQRAERRDKEARARPDLLNAMFNAEATCSLMQRVQPGQTFATFRAGFEATAAALLFTLLELAYNPDIQRRLQRELDSVALEDLISSGRLEEIKFLDKVIKEGLRKYPPNATLVRRVTSDGVVMQETGLRLRKGSRVVVPVFAIGRDPALFPEPERFDPERDQPANPLFFGCGQRSCIAQRFALQQMKVGLVAVLQYFSVAPCPSSPAAPLQFLAGRSIVLALKQQDCVLRLSHREPHA